MQNSNQQSVLSLPAIGMVFGVFDGLHPGHHFFFREAVKRCETLMVVVTPDEVVETLKGRRPLHSLNARIQAIRSFDPGLKIIAGDEVLGSWGVLHTHQPTIIFLGHDQQGLRKALEEFSIPVEYIDAYQPDVYKSGLLNRSLRKS